jgi:hypothetical protein
MIYSADRSFDIPNIDLLSYLFGSYALALVMRGKADLDAQTPHTAKLGKRL